MSRKKPNIITTFDGKAQRNNFIQNVFDDMFVSHHTPNSISLDGVLFTLPSQTRNLYRRAKIDSSSDYVDIYLQSVKTPSSYYEIQMMVQI